VSRLRSMLLLPVPSSSGSILTVIPLSYWIDELARLGLVSDIRWRYDLAGHLVVEGLLIAVIVFQLTRKSYKPPKKPLTEKVRCSSHC
jgi:serine palmitoyltransferase